MSFIEINGANIFYTTFGKDRPGQSPVVLIHGSLSTGANDWSLVAPLLARDYKVILPDCRGHGQSSNPNHSYSFKEMAADIAGLVRALGYERAHIIGHSNGGNVAVVVLMEHPEVVQTAIIQAGNARITPEMLEREPAYFDPDRAEREQPQRVAKQVELHGATHGKDYWRELFKLTLPETIREPNYTPEQLAKVERPTLVIQGEKDQANAPSRQAQYIGQYIPEAELWLPAGVGHNVHDEILFEWMGKVQDFLSRRGTQASEMLYRLKRRCYPDSRESIFDLSVQEPLEANAPLQLTGQVLAESQASAALEALSLLGRRADASLVKALVTRQTPWALVSRNVSDVRRQPYYLSELTSQVLFGEPVRIMQEGDEWDWVRSEQDGYMGYVKKAALHTCTEQFAAAYQEGQSAIISVGLSQAYSAHPKSKDAQMCGKLPFSAPLVLADDAQDGWQPISLPDGRVWWVASGDLLPLSQRPPRLQGGIQLGLSIIRQFVGIPYHWGGRSPFGYDCSGLAQIFYQFMGIQIPRDADQQMKAGLHVEGEPQPGDLLYFGEPDEDTGRQHVSHTAISLGNKMMIHANGAAGGISYNSLEPSSPIYRPWLDKFLVGVRRYE